MQYESPSQDPRLSVDERLKLLYPMVKIRVSDSEALVILLAFRLLVSIHISLIVRPPAGE